MILLNLMIASTWTTTIAQSFVLPTGATARRSSSSSKNTSDDSPRSCPHRLPFHPPHRIFSTTTSKHERPNDGSSITATSSSINNNVSLLQDKLEILQDVVEELHLRQKASKHLTDQTERERRQSLDRMTAQWEASQETARQRAQTIQHLERELTDVLASQQREAKESKRRQEAEALRSAQVKFQGQLLDLQTRHDQTVTRLQDTIETQQKEILRLVDKLREESASFQEEVAALRAQAVYEKATEEAALLSIKEVAKSMERQDALRLELAEKQLEASKVEHKKVVEAYRKRVEDLLTELESLQLQVEAEVKADADRKKQQLEQVEIATAAVRAAEMREGKLLSDVTNVQTHLRQSRLEAKILKLTLDGFGKENGDLRDENRKLKDALEAAQERITGLQEHIQSYARKSENGIWRRMRSQFSKRRT